MPLGEVASCAAECPEVGSVGNTGQHFFEVGGEAGFVFGAMEDAIDVVEDVLFGDFAVAIDGLKFYLEIYYRLSTDQRFTN
jgi:hypothetical protein